MLFSTHDDMGKAILTVDTAKQRNVPVHSSHFPELCDFDLEENVVEKADKSNDLRSSTATRIVEKVKSLMEEQQKTVAFEAASIALKQQRNQPSAQVASTSSTTSANINTVRFSPAENRVFLNAVQGIHKRADSAGKQATANSLSNSPSSSPSSSSSATTLSIIAAPHRPFTSNTQAIASTSIYGYLTESVTSWSRSTAESYIKSVKDNVNHYTGLVVGKEGATHPSLTTTAVSLAIAPVAITAATASTSYNLASQAAQTTSTAIKSTASLGVETATSIASSATQRATHIVEKATAHAQFSISSAKNTVSSSTLAASTAVKGFTESSLNYSLSLLPVSIDATVRGTLQTIPFVSSLDLQQSARRGKLSILEFEDGVFSCDLNNNSLISAVRNSHVVVCDSNAPVAIVKKIKSSIGYLSQTQLKFVESNHPSSSELAAVNKTSELVANYLRQGFTVLRIRCSSSNHESTQISKIMGFNGEEKITIFDIRPPPALPSKVTPTSLGPPPGYYRGRRQSIAYEAPARNSDPARLDF